MTQTSSNNSSKFLLFPTARKVSLFNSFIGYLTNINVLNRTPSFIILVSIV